MKLALVLSVALNLALAVVTIRDWGTHSPARQKTAAAVRTTLRYELPQSAPAVQPLPATNAFNWRVIESSDYEQYVANLRAIGCPEKTVRDIIQAEIQKAYNAKFASVPLSAGFWSCGLEREAAERRRATQQSELRSESRTLLQRLIGAEYATEPSQDSNDLMSQAILRFFIGPLPQEVTERVNSAMEKSSSLAAEIRDRSNGILLPADKEQLVKVRQQALGSLQQLLSADQFDELTRRFAALRLDSQGFDDFHVNGAELRHIAGLYVSAFGPPLEEAFNSPNEEEESTGGAKKEWFQQKLQEFLGQARYAEYQRDTDPDFKSIQTLAQQQALPQETALKIYEVKSLFDSECRRLRGDALLSDADLAVQLQQVQDSTRSAINQLLGDTLFDHYVRQHGGGWVTNSLRP